MQAIASTPTVLLTKIMYATDFSPVAERAGEYAKQLALRFGANVQIVNVLPLCDDGMRAIEPQERQLWKARLTSRENEFRAAGVNSYYSFSRDYPIPDALLLREMQFGPDLIVVGTESKSHLDRLLLGSTSEHLIREAHSPVLTVGPNAKAPKNASHLFERILFATDFSQASNKAGSLALGLAHQTSAHLWICHIKTVKIGEENTGASKRIEEQRFRDEVASLMPPDAYDWCLPECAGEVANPAKGILRAAETVGADLIVMGARARSFWLMHMHRGVTQDVLAAATCPVLTVH